MHVYRSCALLVNDDTARDQSAGSAEISSVKPEVGRVSAWHHLFH